LCGSKTKCSAWRTETDAQIVKSKIRQNYSLEISKKSGNGQERARVRKLKKRPISDKRNRRKLEIKKFLNFLATVLKFSDVKDMMRNCCRRQKQSEFPVQVRNFHLACEDRACRFVDFQMIQSSNIC